MPANLTPQYLDAEQRFRRARTAAEKVACLEEMLRVIPKHKGTDKLQADLKRRMSRLRHDAQQAAGARRGPLVTVDREGAGQIVLIGPANAGKSALLAALTNATPEIADYPFTTRKPLPGMLMFENIQIQLVDMPPLSHDFMESWMGQIVRNADALFILVDLGAAEALDGFDMTLDILRGWKVLPVAQPLSADEEDALESGVVPIPALLVGTKADLEGSQDTLAMFQELYGDQWSLLPVSVTTGQHLARLKEAAYRLLHQVRVYTKAPGKKPDLESPFTLPQGSTVEDVAAAVHRDFVERLKFARVWGEKAYDGQMVQRDYVVQEGDVIELHV